MYRFERLGLRTCEKCLPCVLTASIGTPALTAFLVTICSKDMSTYGVWPSAASITVMPNE